MEEVRVPLSHPQPLDGTNQTTPSCDSWPEQIVVNTFCQARRILGLRKIGINPRGPSRSRCAMHPAIWVRNWCNLL